MSDIGIFKTAFKQDYAIVASNFFDVKNINFELTFHEDPDPKPHQIASAWSKYCSIRKSYKV